MTPSSLRCRYCGIGWPDLAPYAECPQCLEPTVEVSRDPDMTLQEATAMRRRCEFNWYLAATWFELPEPADAV